VRTVERIVQPQVHALTGAYVCHALGLDEERDFERHLAQCPDCATEVAELRETATLLAMTVVKAPPPRMRALVMANIDLTRQLPPITAVSDDPSTRARDAGSGRDTDPAGLGPIRQVLGRRGRGQIRTRPGRRVSRKVVAGWAVAAVLAGVVVALSAHEGAENRQLSQATARTAAISALLSAPDVHSGSSQVRGGGSVTVIDSRGRGQAEITLRDMPALPAGRAYQLWLIDSSTMRSAGVVAATTESRSVLADDLGDATSVAITVEPAAGSAQPTTAPILLMNMPT
jgi:anti-sigma-K factor RskA